MRCSIVRSSRSGLAVVASGLLVLCAAAQAQVSAGKSAPGTDAVAACEKAARQSLATQAATQAELTFNGAPTVQPTLSSESQMVLRGGVRVRSAAGVRTYDYSCDVDPRTYAAVGLVMRDTTPTSTAPARPAADPDLSHVSPQACETSAAEALKQRWPRVAQISFDTATRTLLQESASKARLHGHGRALPTPGAPSTHFGFECDIDPRDGRLLGTRVSG